MSMNREGRPTRPETAVAAGGESWTGNRALMLEVPLIFEIGEDGGRGVDFEAAPATGGTRLAGLERHRPIVDAEQRRAADQVLRLMALYREKEDLFSVGAYQQGSDPMVDTAIRMRDQIESFLIQPPEDRANFADTRRALIQLAASAAA